MIINPQESPVITCAQGLFIITRDGIFKYEEGKNCFQRVKICDQDGNEIQEIGTINDPK